MIQSKESYYVVRSYSVYFGSKMPVSVFVSEIAAPWKSCTLFLPIYTDFLPEDTAGVLLTL